MNTNMLGLRAANKSDIPSIRSLVEEIWPVTYGKILTGEQIQYMLDRLYAPDVLAAQMQQEHHYIMAETNDGIIGFAAYAATAIPGIFHLHKIYLATAAQGKGFGKQLLKEVMDQCRALGARFLRLNVNRHNPARSFYEKTGFAVIASEDIDIGQGYFMNDYVMEYDLSHHGR